MVEVLGSASTRVVKSNRIRQMLVLAGQISYLQFWPGARFDPVGLLIDVCSMKVMLRELRGAVADPEQLSTSASKD